MGVNLSRAWRRRSGTQGLLNSEQADFEKHAASLKKKKMHVLKRRLFPVSLFPLILFPFLVPPLHHLVHPPTPFSVSSCIYLLCLWHQPQISR